MKEYNPGTAGVEAEADCRSFAVMAPVRLWYKSRAVTK
jgi:hypothetical protein